MPEEHKDLVRYQESPHGSIHGTKRSPQNYGVGFDSLLSLNARLSIGQNSLF